MIYRIYTMWEGGGEWWEGVARWGSLLPHMVPPSHHGGWRLHLPPTPLQMLSLLGSWAAGGMGVMVWPLVVMGSWAGAAQGALCLHMHVGPQIGAHPWVCAYLCVHMHVHTCVSTCMYAHACACARVDNSAVACTRGKMGSNDQNVVRMIDPKGLLF